MIDQLVEKATELKHQMFPHLTVPMHVGNMYSASVWAQIMFILENTARVGDVIYFGSYGSGATCISGLLRVMPGVQSFRKTHPTVTDYLNQKIRTTAQEYEMVKQAKILPKVSLGYIEEHSDNEHRGIELHFCDNGCLIPNISGLNHCPHGHPGFHKMFYPLYAVLISDPEEILDVDDKRFVNNGLVRILGNPQKGALLEYNMRRIQTNVEESAFVQGLLNWAPTYVPIKTLIHHTP